MSENQDETRTVDLDTVFLRSRRGIVKVLELVGHSKSLHRIYGGRIFFSTQPEEFRVKRFAAGTRQQRDINLLNAKVTLFVAFVCFTAASVPQYIVATIFEFLITLFLLLLHLLKLNKKLKFFFWPLVDVFNSTFAAVYLIVVSLIVLTTYTVTGILIGGVLCLICAALHGVESYTLFKNITFNKRRNESQNQANH